MTKENVTQLYHFTSRLIFMLEDELDILQDNDTSAIDAKRNVTETLNKVVTLLVQLNKLSKEEEPDDQIGVDDQAIIDGFMAKVR